MIQQEIYEFGPYLLDSAQMLLRRNGSVVQLQPRALETLLALARQRGGVVSKQHLMDAVWPDSFVEEGNLTQNIFLLRRELGKTPDGEEYIQTVPKRGYRMNVPVTNRLPETTGQNKVLGSITASPEAIAGASVDAPPVVTVGNTHTRLTAAGPLLAMLAILALALLAAGLWRVETAQPHGSGYLQITNDGALKRVMAEQVGGPDAALFTDGARLYFTEGSADAPAIVQVSVNGGETARIPIPLELPALLDFSASRSELLASGSVDPANAPPLWAVPVPAGTTRRVGEVSAWDASWSPDGRELAFVQGADLYLAKSDGGDARLLAELPGRGWQPRWSPDGQRLRLTVFDVPASIHSLWEVSREGAGLHRLLQGWRAGYPAEDGPVDICCGNWTPDGTYYVFQVTHRDRSDIWSIPGKPRLLAQLFPSIEEPVQVTSGQLSSMAPAFSPDGRKLFVIGQQLRGELDRFDSRTRQFVPYLGGISAEFIDFSRNGQWVAYVAYPDRTLWRSRVDGTDKLQLSFPPLKVAVPQWSPDGSQIAFYSTSGGDRQRLYIISANGGAARPASSNGGGEMTPHWSPDGGSIIYSDFPFFAANPDEVAVHCLELKTQTIETLPGSQGLFGPTWSPDGRYVTAFAVGGQRIMLFDFKTGAWTELALGSGLARWSSDSQYVYYLRFGAEPAVMRVGVNDRHVDQVASLKGIRQAGTLAGLSFGITTDGDPLVLKDVGTQEVYSLMWHER